MRVFRGAAEVDPGFGPSVVTIGKFDGLHAGHRAVIGELVALARAEGLASAVVTFDRNPLALLAPDRCPPDLVGLDQKLDLLAGTGVDATLVLAFDRVLSEVPAAEFVTRFLVGALRARIVLVGADFRFGHRGAGDMALLRALGAEHGFEVRVIGDVLAGSGERVSSTRIRALLAEGDIAAAAVLLGRPPALRGTVVPGARRGRELGFPTANLSPESQGLIPADGVYAGWLTDAGVRYPAAISVGDNPTFQGVPQRQVEAYVLDEDLDLYGHEVEVAFAGRIRGMVAFEGVPALIAQMTADVETTRTILGLPPRP